ncbi:helix-turn-helix domain-containing protein [Photobacterium damselae]|uniref:helix-turn-helix domain-containing protein n=1 Tax=Photobacterium damselae TaxID=38293 RepID=UPI000D668F26|nr:S24 family peptidase [Photobacterium damselae]AWK84057.1 hypothetical protein BST98_18920 [Photobacterium damselae]
MNQTFGQRLKNRREELKITQEKLAFLTGITRVGITKIELDQTKNARADTLIALSKALNCNPEWLLTGKQSKELLQKIQRETHSNIEFGPQIHRYVPEINWVQAGEWTETIDDIKDGPMHPCPAKCSNRTFALRIKGDSMEPRFEEGDLIFVDPDQLDPPTGKYIVAQLEGSSEATFKQLQITDGQKMLKALNPNYPSDMRYLKIDSNCKIIGTVVSHVKPV